MLKFPHDQITCIPRDGYTSGRAPTFRMNPALNGRPRSTLRDHFPSYSVNMNFQLTETQFHLWQSFWQALGNGRDWFHMTLDVTGISREYECHAVGPYNSEILVANRYAVSLSVEAKDRGL